MDVKHIDLNTIKPESKGDGEFFSWQLFKWVKKFSEYTRIYLAPWNNVNGFNTDKPTLMIGFRFDDGWVHRCGESVYSRSRY
ncbi:MAG: hypothetical protein IBX55_20725 [Methyloprofundus sp.]|nr:hypothetical protein [Methyloprofundus sp.]